ncbi:MAG: ATP-dependent Clp protease ATP-binding subunit [Candidatus Berkelbacteria bacterium]|nr:ATP-dependent Clp protease ATP-binding subunit [Candidatus Berkelbacteria bacterium]
MDNIFRKFSGNLRKILTLAEKIAHDSGRPLESEDLLLAIVLSKGTLANDILTNFDILPEKVQIVAKLVSSQSQKESDRGISKNAKSVIQKTLKIASDFGHLNVDAEHLLLALISDPKLNSYSIIERIGADPKKIKEQIEAIFSEISKAFSPESLGILGATGGIPGVNFGSLNADDEFFEPQGRTTTKESQKSLIELYTVDLTAAAERNKLDPVIGRESEIERLTQILSRRTKNNPLLIGEPGVGKTAIVEGLAKKISSGDVPTTLIGKKVLSLDVSGLLAGTIYRGQFEARLKNLLAEILKIGKVILFIDEIHNTIGTGSADGSLDIANMLKPTLTSGEINFIGATTIESYRKYLEKDPAFERRFQVIKIEEPTVEDTIKIIRGLKSKYEKHHGVKISPDAIEAAAVLSQRYVADRFLPDKAVDLIDEAAAATNVASPEGTKISKLKNKLIEIQTKKDESVVNENYEAATNFREIEIKIIDEISKLEAGISKEKQNLISARDIARVVAKSTGVKIENLTLDERQKYLELESKLKKNVIGQEEAIGIIANSIRRNRAGVSDPKRPIGSFLFLGPTGVGKTYLTKQLAGILFGSEENLIRIDMSEFAERHNVSRLVGAPAGYVGYDDGGQLTDAIRQKPYSIILFDEIEKAHPDFFNILLQILDDGILTDAKGRAVNFRNTIIVMTSNLGTKELSSQHDIGFGVEAKSDDKIAYEKIKEKVQDSVKKELRPEFVNRLDSIVVFRSLAESAINKIVELNLQTLVKRLKKQNIVLKISKEVVAHLAKAGYSDEFGARPIRRIISDQLENQISESIISERFVSGDKISAKVLGDKIILTR